MPTTPPKTDPSLERLARAAAQRIAQDISYLDPGPPSIEQAAAIILQTLAPLGEVVARLRDTTDEIEHSARLANDDADLVAASFFLELAIKNRNALHNLDAGREE